MNEAISMPYYRHVRNDGEPVYELKSKPYQAFRAWHKKNNLTFSEKIVTIRIVKKNYANP